jgi:NAD(P)-dependent dehydrogenase (short-subunit alcohol dehydrogenase family)
MCRISHLIHNRCVLISKYAAGAARTTLAGVAVYCVSKPGMRGLTMTAAAQLAHSGVRVSAVHPGSIGTAVQRSTGDELLPAHESFAIPGAATLAEIAGYLAFSGLPNHANPTPAAAKRPPAGATLSPHSTPE